MSRGRTTWPQAPAAGGSGWGEAARDVASFALAAGLTLGVGGLVVAGVWLLLARG